MEFVQTEPGRTNWFNRTDLIHCMYNRHSSYLPRWNSLWDFVEQSTIGFAFETYNRSKWDRRTLLRELADGSFGNSVKAYFSPNHVSYRFHNMFLDLSVSICLYVFVCLYFSMSHRLLYFT